jgi:pyruvyl transferase EpsO
MMTIALKILKLKQLIKENLTSLITNDYVLLDLPYFANIGDVMIWQGVLDFLKTVPYKCLYASSIENYKKPTMKEDVIILLMGGGNFGDLWYRHQIFRRMILSSFSSNPIVQLPQSIHYKDENVSQEDVVIFNKCKNLTICLRDKPSLAIANTCFTNSQNILVPDMAFYVDINRWKKHINPCEKNRILFLDRKDCEKNITENYTIVPPEAENRDWPVMEKTAKNILVFKRIQKIAQKIDGIFLTSLNNIVSDFVYQRFLRKYYIRTGISFLSAYSYIYTTRLHAAILSVLLEKEFAFFDNSYGKNKGVFEAWLQDVDGIKFIEK